MRAALFSYVWRRGEQCHGVDDRPGESCSSRGVVHVLCSYGSGFEGGGVEVGCPASSRASSMEVRMRYSGRHGDVLSPCVPTASGLSSQWGWPHRADSDGENRSRRPDVTA
jgi:hypothetical protein